MVYEWKGRHYSVNANIVGKEVEKIERENGEVTAKSIVDAARPVDSALHELFEWDDEKAAEHYRRHQAVTMLCALNIVCEETKEPKTVKAYMNVAESSDNPTRRTGKFINTQDAFMDKEKRNLILRCAIRELKEIQRKYSNLQELSNIFNEIDKL